MAKNVLIVAPYFCRPYHVGRVRIERFIRWLGQAGFAISLVRAGESDHLVEQSWGREVIVADPLGLHAERPGPDETMLRKEYCPLVLKLSSLIFCPDPGIVWGRRVLRQRIVRQLATAADLVISSSPPESCHLLAKDLADLGRGQLLVDMRDGWLDEPLKPELARSGFARWRESRLEGKILSAASRIFVSSSSWRELLLSRYPRIQDKVDILTNCCAPEVFSSEVKMSGRGETCVQLVHAGQFSGSKYNNRPELLFNPLLAALSRSGQKVEVLCLGRFTREDIACLDEFALRFAALDCRFRVHEPVSRNELKQVLNKANGLLLLSATRASILAKTFDYLPSGLPVLAVTPVGSAVGKLGSKVPQMVVQPINSQDIDATERFLTKCVAGEYTARVPTEFTDEYCQNIFMQTLDSLSL